MKYILNKLFIYLMLLGVYLEYTWYSRPMQFFSYGTENLGTPSIKISTGTGVLASGTGLVTQPATIDITIPDSADVKQVLLYWESQHYSPAGDDKILFDDIEVTGTQVGGPEIWYEEENADEILQVIGLT